MVAERDAHREQYEAVAFMKMQLNMQLGAKSEVIRELSELWDSTQNTNRNQARDIRELKEDICGFGVRAERTSERELLQLPRAENVEPSQVASESNITCTPPRGFVSNNKSLGTGLPNGADS